MFHENIHDKRWSRLAYIALAILAAIFFDVFFNNRQLGLGWFVFVFVFIYAFLALAFITNQLRQKTALLLTLPILILSFDVVLYNNELVTALVPWIVFILVILLFVLATLHNPSGHKFKLLNIPVLRNFALWFGKMALVYKDLSGQRDCESGKNYKKIATALLIAFPILLLFGVLFYSADMVFANLLDNVFKIKISPEAVWRTLRGLVIFVFLSGLFYATLSREHSLLEYVNKVKAHDNFIASTVLGLINALFLLFVIIQIKYLFGSSEFVLQNGLTYAKYARQGFFQLAAVLVISSALLFYVYRSYCTHNGGKLMGFLQLFLSAQVCLIALSALKRMNLYQDAYGFTVLRLYVEWFIYLVILVQAIYFVAVILKVEFNRLFQLYLVLGLSAFTLVASLNVDKIIARKNVDRMIVGSKQLDITYLIMGLSVDALPEVRRVFERGFTNEQISNSNYIDNTKLTRDFSEAIFKYKYHVKDLLSKDSSWIEFNFGRETAKKLLKIN